MTKFEEEAIKEAQKSEVIATSYDDEFTAYDIGLNIKLERGTYNFPWLEFAKNWHSDEEFQKLVKKNNKLKSQLQQQALPVVPDYVGNAVMKINLEHLFTGYTNGINEKAKNWLERHKGVKSLGYYVCQLRFQGFTIEKPQLFYLCEKNTGYYLRKSGTDWYGITSHYSNDSDENYMNYKFTKQEIDSMETGSYELVPVEDGE